MRKVMLAVLLLLAVGVILPSALAGAVSKSWYLDVAAHPVVTTCLNMDLTAPTSTGNVQFNKESEHVWLTSQAAQTPVSFPAGTWTIVLKTGDDWYGDMQIALGYWDGSFKAFDGQTSAKISSGLGFITIEIQISLPSKTIDPGNYLALRVMNTGKNPHHILTGESGVHTPPNDPGYPVPEWTSGILLGLGVAGLGGFAVWRRKLSRSSAADRT